MNSASTETLLRKASAGSETAFAKLLDLHTVRLVLYIKRHAGRAVRSDADEEDLFQIVACRAWQMVRTFESQGQGSFYRWLTVLARHEIANRVRYVQAKGRLKARQQAEGTTDSERAPNEPVAHGPSPSSVAARREKIERVNRAIIDLPPTQREVIEAYLLDEKPLSAIASEFGLAKSTVWERLSRAMGTLKANLGKLHSSITA